MVRWLVKRFGRPGVGDGGPHNIGQGGGVRLMPLGPGNAGLNIQIASRSACSVPRLEEAHAKKRVSRAPSRHIYGRLTQSSPNRQVNASPSARRSAPRRGIRRGEQRPLRRASPSRQRIRRGRIRRGGRRPLRRASPSRLRRRPLDTFLVLRGLKLRRRRSPDHTTFRSTTGASGA